MKYDMKKRLPYLIVFLVLLGIEILIALFINDNFIRPYLGDVIVVWTVYFFIQIFTSGRFKSATAVGTFLFAVLVELLQMINIVKLLGLSDIPFFRTLIGTHFDIKDIICYAVGTAVLLFFIFSEKYFYKPLTNKKK